MRYFRHWPWLLLAIPVVWGISRLRLDVEVLNLLPGEFAVVEGLKRYQANFANAREFIVTVESPAADTTETAARWLAGLLRAQTNLVSAVAWQPPFQEYPGQAAEFLAYLWFNQPPAAFGELTNRLGRERTNVLVEARERLATSLSPTDLAFRGYDPYGLTQLPDLAGNGGSLLTSDQDLFVSSDGTFRVLFVESKPDLTNYRQCVEWFEAITAQIENSRREAGIPDTVEFQYTGRPAFVTEIAGGMERDMLGSVGGTMVIIALLFYWAHRRWTPLLWLLALLLLILLCTTALGGLAFGTVNVVSMGFAAILLGLAVDYGLVMYQEARAWPTASARALRRELAPSIVWSALTTASAFAMLNLSGLPGLAQLGSFVAIGVILAATFMLGAYLPPLLRNENRPSDVLTHATEDGPAHGAHRKKPRFGTGMAWAATGLVAVIAVFELAAGGPGFDSTANALRPEHSRAYAAVEKIKTELGRPQEPLWILFPGRDEAEVAAQLRRAEPVLGQALSNGWISAFTLPTALWPQAEHQESNRTTAEVLGQLRPESVAAARAFGFTSNAVGLTESMLAAWTRAASVPGIFWPTNQASEWLFGKILARPSGQFLVLGLVYPSTNTVATGAGTSPATSGNDLEKFVELWNARAGPEVGLLSGWELLGTSIFEVVKRDLPRVLGPMSVLLLVSLTLAFRGIREVLLSVATLLFSAVVLWVVMDLMDWSWNLMNMMALPLLLGAGVDYSIHMQLALRRHDGDVLAVRRSIGRALFLCAATTFTGFGSLAFSANAGMASLGQVCALGILSSYLTAVFLLPAWWKLWIGRGDPKDRAEDQ